MQDRNYEKLGKKGWEGMEAMLDKEMPVRRRRGAFLWLFLGVLVMGGVGYWGLGLGEQYGVGSQESRGEKSIVESRESGFVVTADQASQQRIDTDKSLNKVDKSPEFLESRLSTENRELSAENGVTFDKSVVLSQEVVVGKSIVESQESGVAFTENPNEKKSNDLLNSSENPESRLPTEKGVLSQESEIIIVDEQGEEKHFSVDKIQELDDSRLMTHDSRLMTAYKPLPTVNRQLPTELSSIEINQSLTKTKRNLPLFFLLQAGAMQSRFNNMNGYYIGMGFEKNVTRRWSLSTGVQYASLNSESLRKVLSRNIAADLESNVDTNTELPVNELNQDPVINSLDDQSYDLIYEEFSELSYLTIPLTLNYRTTRRSSAGIGLNYSIVLSSTPEMFQHNGNGSFNAFGGLSTRNFSRKNMFGITASYRYRLYKGLQFKAEGLIGLNGVLKTEQKQGFGNTLSYVSAGFEYKL